MTGWPFTFSARTYSGLPKTRPRSLPVVHVAREYIHVVVTDEMDVPFVSRLKIVK